MLTDGAPLLPRSVIMDVHRRKRRDELEAAKAFTFAGASGRFSSRRILSVSTVLATGSRGWKTPLWLQNWHRLVGSAAHGLVSDYIFQQPTIVLVWSFIALNMVHFFVWAGGSTYTFTHDSELAMAAIVGWPFLASGGRGAGGVTITRSSHCRCFIYLFQLLARWRLKAGPSSGKGSVYHHTTVGRMRAQTTLDINNVYVANF